MCLRDLNCDSYICFEGRLEAGCTWKRKKACDIKDTTFLSLLHFCSEAHVGGTAPISAQGNSSTALSSGSNVVKSYAQGNRGNAGSVPGRQWWSV